MPHNISTNDRSYLDVSVLFNWLMASKASYNKPASAFIKEVENGKFSIVISDLALNEFAKTVKNTLVKNGYTNPESWTKKIHECMDRIFKLSGNVTIIPWHITAKDDINYPFLQVSSSAYNLMLKYSGHTIQNRSGQNMHKGLSTADTLHVALARMLKCSMIVTSDKDFEEVEEIPCKRPEDLI